MWAEGARLSVDEAIGLALGAAETRTSRPAGLSEREAEAAARRQGSLDKQIASHLQLSVRTIENHVRHAPPKPGLEIRTQLATWAREHIQVANPRTRTDAAMAAAS